MSDVKVTKFYQFLSKYQSEGGWNKVADGQYGNEDGFVIKSEFRNFLNTEWNGEENGELTNDLINSFWKKIDTNTSASKISGTKLKNNNALDKNETAALEKRLEVYVQFDQFVANNIVIPSALNSTGSQWKSDIVEQLSAKVEEFIAGGCNGDLTKTLEEAFNAIANKCTAQYCAVEYQDSLKSTILADYPEYKVADDTTLQTLINAYIATVDVETDAETIKDEIIDIMDAYLATAELGTDSGYDLSALGFKADKLNDIQIAVITQTIKNDLAEEAKNYEGYEDKFNSAVQEFINAKIKKGGTFEELKAAATEFANSEFKTKLDNLITIETTYRDVQEGSDFYNRLVAEFGESLAKRIAQNDRYIAVYKEIVTEIVDKVNKGEMSMDEVADYAIKKISANLDKFFANGLGDMSLEELNGVYDRLAASAEAQTDDDVAMKQHREAAIKYCDALAKKGSSLKDAVIEAFGSSDYKSAINKMFPGEIQEIMAELMIKALEIGDVSTFTTSGWTGIEDNITLALGATSKPYNITATINNGDKVIDNNRVSYSVKVSGGGSATIDAMGKLNITAANSTGYMKVEIFAMVDGVKVGEPKVVTVKCQEQMNLATVNANFNGKSIAEHMSSGKTALQLSGFKTWSNAKSTAKASVASYIDSLAKTLKAAGFEAARVDAAATTTKNYYNTCIDAIYDHGADSKYEDYNNLTFTYVDANGNTHYEDTKYSQKTRKREKDAGRTSAGAQNIDHNSTGIRMNESYAKTNTYEFYLNTAVLLTKFQNFFNTL